MQWSGLPAGALALAASLSLSASAADYPVGARLTLAPAGQQRCLKVAGGGPSNCGIAAQARVAFAEVVARMFTARPVPDLELVLTVEDAEIFEQANGGLVFDVGVAVRVQSPDGALLDTVRAGGRATVTGASAVDAAALEASRSAARDFEIKYARSEAVANYLVGKRLAPPEAVAIQPRGSRLAWLAAGIGLGNGGDDSVTTVPSLRLGASFKWFMVQAMYARHSPAFQAELFQSGEHLFVPGDLSTSDFGLEAGAVVRLGFLELHAGPGLHYLTGTAQIEDDSHGILQSASYSKLSPALFASLQTAFLPFRNGLRFLAGVEARVYFASSVDLPDFSRRVPIMNDCFSIFLGVELPWMSDPEGKR
jgi:hypothetical protein